MEEKATTNREEVIKEYMIDILLVYTVFSQ